jgi:hypothetical protein
MQISSRSLFRTAIIFLGVMLALGLFVGLNHNKQASALSPSQWETVRSYIDSYFSGQYNAGLDGEAGIRMGKVDLWNRLDSNGDISPNAGAGVGANGVAVTGVLGEGDDAANRPVLIDNLRTQTNIIPGTEFRCNWNANEDCYADTSISAIRQIVDNHAAAGFSTDIVDYCVSSQTAGPTTGGFGIIAQVPGALSSDTSLIPNVYIADYSRNGWRNNLSVASGTGALTSPEAATGVPNSAPGTVANCDGAATDYELVRCQANWAISSTGGNVGNGTTNMALIDGAQQSVDIRNGTINTISTAGTNLQVPINTLFSLSGLAQLDPAKTTTMVTRTQMGANASIGLEMLGYNNAANAANINGGISRWNGTEGEQQVAFGDGLPTESIGAYGAAGPVDTTGPTVSSVGSSNVTSTSADIDRTAGEPATMKVEYGTSPGVYTMTANNTVLNAVKTVGLSSLAPSTTYYVQVTSYDGYANGTVSSEFSFTTAAPPCTPAKPTLNMSMSNVYWASAGDYAARTLSVDLSIANNGANDASAVTITGATVVPALVSMTGAPHSAGSIAASTSGSVTVTYNVPMGVTAFKASMLGTAVDDCDATSYSMP